MVGPPGSGKSTYCRGLHQYLSSLAVSRSNVDKESGECDGYLKNKSDNLKDNFGDGEYSKVITRMPFIINLDPAAYLGEESCENGPAVDICELKSVQTIMETELLGPNGALLSAIENLEINLDWLFARLQNCINEAESVNQEPYFIFDLPGQVELTTCHDSFQKIIRKLEKFYHFRLVVVHLADATHCTDPFRYISMVMLALRAMLHLECPQINVLSKIDLINTYGTPPLPIEFYLAATDLESLLLFDDPKEVDFVESDNLEDETFKDLSNKVEKCKFKVPQKYKILTRRICELIEENALICFSPLAIDDRECMSYLQALIDRAGGYAFGGLTVGNESIIDTAVSWDRQEEYIIDLVNERYIDSKARFSP